jgi:hypothetical protein
MEVVDKPMAIGLNVLLVCLRFIVLRLNSNEHKAGIGAYEARKA